MKNKYYVLIAMLVLSITSCTFSWSSSNQSGEGVMYAGRIVFSPTGDEVGAVSANGFLSFTDVNKKTLDVKSDAKHVLTYQINQGDITTKPTDEEKALIAEAFKYCQQNGMITIHSPFILDDKVKK